MKVVGQQYPTVYGERMGFAQIQDGSAQRTPKRFVAQYRPSIERNDGEKECGTCSGANVTGHGAAIICRAQGSQAMLNQKRRVAA
jgi:hypothetical protein